jgi:hypothetical protein
MKLGTERPWKCAKRSQQDLIVAKEEDGGKRNTKAVDAKRCWANNAGTAHFKSSAILATRKKSH